MGISMISLFENNKKMENLSVFLLGIDISADNKDKLKKIAEKYGRSIYIKNVDLSNIPDYLFSKRWPKSAFIRLYSGYYLPVYVESILYVDCDTIITASLSDLENFQTDYVICGVKDCVSKFYKRNIGLSDNEIYINGGVLIINLKKLRTMDLNNRIQIFLRKFKFFMSYADQDILNGSLKDEIGEIPPVYNVMTVSCVYSYREVLALRAPSNYYLEDEILHSLHYPKIIHFTSHVNVVRPWYSNSSHPCSSLFYEFLNKSPWEDIELISYKASNIQNRCFALLEKLPQIVKILSLRILHVYVKPFLVKVKGSVLNLCLFR